MTDPAASLGPLVPGSSLDGSPAVPGGEYIRERFKGDRGDLRYPPLPEPLAVPVFDNHTHLEIADGDEPLNLAEQLDRASAVGVAGVIQVGGDVESSRWSADAAQRDARVLAAVAIHPNEAPGYAEAGTLDAAIAIIDELAAQPRVRAVGETGLDFFRTEAGGWPAQFRSFEAHIEIAKRHGIALQIHDREAHDAVLETLERVGAPDTTVFHCFSGDEAMATYCAERGYYLSFAGNVTFKNAQNLRDALLVTPRERVLIETDAPFLTPEPTRGRPNAPYLIPHTLRFMAGVLGEDADVLAADISANTVRAYGEWGTL